MPLPDVALAPDGQFPEDAADDGGQGGGAGNGDEGGLGPEAAYASDGEAAATSNDGADALACGPLTASLAVVAAVTLSGTDVAIACPPPLPPRIQNQRIVEFAPVTIPGLQLAEILPRHVLARPLVMKYARAFFSQQTFDKTQVYSVPLHAGVVSKLSSRLRPRGHEDAAASVDDPWRNQHQAMHGGGSSSTDRLLKRALMFKTIRSTPDRLIRVKVGGEEGLCNDDMAIAPHPIRFVDASAGMLLVDFQCIHGYSHICEQSVVLSTKSLPDESVLDARAWEASPDLHCRLDEAQFQTFQTNDQEHMYTHIISKNKIDV